MIKTLQISSILAVILAVILFVSSVVFGVHKDEQLEAFLKSPGVREQFAKTTGAGAKKRSANQRSPLVERAERFASIMNPPKPKVTQKPATGIAKKPEIPKPQGPVTPKFRLFGTVVCESNPQMSLALLDEPGKGLHMVRQGSVVMHLTIELVQDGRIVVRDAKGTSEMVVEEGPPPTSAVAAGVAPLPPAIPSGRRQLPPGSGRTYTSVPSRPSIPPQTGGNGRRGPATAASIRARLSNEENARLAALGDRIKAMQDAKAGNKVELSEAEEDAKAAAIIKKLMTDSNKEEPATKQDPNRSKTSTSMPPRPPRR